ncbi:lipid A deacylase LpxR family protein [Tepidicaulis sp. LMO-SS28]|uniref:lipid A deacylase LpxR family protein n=1 Tax=Tepidicaulis sp. LMO-SS28 TaxID=3447455 RepID=UPI003EE0C00C
MREIRCAALGFSGALFFASATAAFAGEDRDLLPQDNGFVTLQVENDLFAHIANTDRHYTNGLQGSWLSSPREMPGWMGPLTKLPVPGRFEASTISHHRVGVSLGQAIFTPDDTETSTPVPDDRPYAGWLHLTFTLQTVYRTNSNSAMQDQWKLDLGVVGPAALGEQAQNNWHVLIGADEANGWDNQLENEPGVNLTLERAWRSDLFATPEVMGFETDFIPHGVLALGNVQTYAGLGGTLRFGPDLPDDFGPPRIYPGIGGSEWFHADSGFDWYLFAGVEGRAVARDIFLDGNTFRDSPSVDKKNFVADFKLGAVAVVGRARVSFTHILRTREFHGQDKPDQFGGITIGWAL